MDGDYGSGEDGFALRLEREGLVVLPGEPFTLAAAEQDLISPRHSDGRAKSISLGPSDAVRGAAANPETRARLAALMARYRAWAEGAITALAPVYAASLERGRTSLRTREAADGASSPRKDDRLLHVDAFASQPTGGRRILRVFTNINPVGEARRWRVGEPFEAYAARWLKQVRRPWPGESVALRRLGITRGLRTPYDWLMLGLHDAAKLDVAYQRDAPRREAAFPAGTSWIVYTDSVVHAAAGGRFALEHTVYLPAQAMASPALAPVRILERMTGRRLV